MVPYDRRQSMSAEGQSYAARLGLAMRWLEALIHRASGAQEAMASLNQSALDGPTITVDPAKHWEERPPRATSLVLS